MKRNLSLTVTMLALAALACNSLIKLPIGGLKTIPTETFSIDEPLPSGDAIKDITFGMAASTATLTIAGGAKGLVEGQIQYNVAEWKPTLITSSGALRVEQTLPDGTIGGSPGGSINQWDIKLGNGLQNVHVICSSGNFTLFLTNTLPNVVNISIEIGTGNFHLVIPTGVAASVNVNRGPFKVATEGAWTQNNTTYTTSGSNPVWMIKLVMGVGNLTLASN